MGLKRGMKPSHPGSVLRLFILPELDITQLELANRLGVSRRTISEIIRERRPITPDMALRLSKAFNPSAEFWLSMQAAYDLWKLDNTKRKSYAKILAFRMSLKRQFG